MRLTFPWPDKPLHSNFRSRSHWPKTNATKKARADAYLIAVNKAPRPKGEVRGYYAKLTLTYHPPHRRYDCQNIPTACKPTIDGLADAMGVDDRHLLVIYPNEFGEVRKPAEIVIDLEQLEAEANG